MSEIKEKELRMYFLVERHLSPIDKGIQAGHSAVEYGYSNKDQPLFKEWYYHHKTFILLNGGIASNMRTYIEFLKKYNIKHSIFEEPDLDYLITSIAFILDDNIFSKEMLDVQDEHTELRLWLSQFRLA